MKNIMVTEVSKITNVSVEDILGRKRYRNISESRQLYWKLLSERGYSPTTIGKLCDRNHATILFGISHINDIIETDSNIAKLWQKILEIRG